MRLCLAALLFAALPLFADTTLTITGSGVDERAPDGTITFRFTVAHAQGSSGTATNVKVAFEELIGLPFASAAGADCTENAPDLVCTLPDIAEGATDAFTISYRSPAQAYFYLFETLTWGDPSLHLTRYANTPTTIYRPIDVTTTDDFAPGSLRAAIDDANAGPCPCRIAFRIPPPVPERGWYTIAPIAPLPHIRSLLVLIDGNRQTELTGDTNLRGPEVEISGARTFADGLVFEGSGEVRDVVVNGFATGGIVADTPGYASLHVHDCYVGTDPTGEIAVPNMRGVWSRSNLVRLTVENNVISGNERSGVFAVGGADIVGNKIGVSASGAPLGNGASGIFAFYGTIEGNTIAHNHDYAIGTPKGTAPLVGENSMFDNGGLSFDIGMDGPGPNKFTAVYDGVAETPSVAGATFDGTNTIIRLHDDELSQPTGNFFAGIATLITLYVFETPQLNRAGFAEAEHFLGKLVVDGQDATLVVPGDLRGHYITAIARRFLVYFEYQSTTSSELSLGTQVR